MRHFKSLLLVSKGQQAERKIEGTAGGGGGVAKCIMHSVMGDLDWKAPRDRFSGTLSKMAPLVKFGSVRRVSREPIHLREGGVSKCNRGSSCLQRDGSDRHAQGDLELSTDFLPDILSVISGQVTRWGNVIRVIPCPRVGEDRYTYSLTQ